MHLSNISPSYRLQFFIKCPSVGPPVGAAPQAQPLLQSGSPWGHQPHQQTCSHQGSSPYGATGPARSCPSAGCLWGHSLLGAPPCSGVGPSMGCRWGSAPPWTSMAEGHNLPHCGLHHGLPGHLCSGTWSSSFPLSALTQVSAGLLLPHTLISLSSCRFLCSWGFFPLLKYVISEVLPPSPMGSALASSRVWLGAGWNYF